MARKNSILSARNNTTMKGKKPAQVAAHVASRGQDAVLEHNRAIDEVKGRETKAAPAIHVLVRGSSRYEFRPQGEEVKVTHHRPGHDTTVTVPTQEARDLYARCLKNGWTKF